jgi:hypothetical protein
LWQTLGVVSPGVKGSPRNNPAVAPTSRAILHHMTEPSEPTSTGTSWTRDQNGVARVRGPFAMLFRTEDDTPLLISETAVADLRAGDEIRLGGGTRHEVVRVHWELFEPTQPTLMVTVRPLEPDLPDTG